MPTQLEKNYQGRFGWLTYINGVEVPATSVSVSTGPNRVSTARINMPPSRYLMGLGRGDRVPVQIFYLERFYFDRPTWCLLYDGEIVGQTKSRSGAGKRQLSFDAVDYNSILSKFYPFLIQNVNNIVTAETQTQASAVSTPTAPFPATTVLLEGAKRPFDFVMNLLDLFRGENLNDDQASVVAKEFYRPWEERTQYVRRFASSEDDEVFQDEFMFPLLREVQEESVLDAVKKIGDRLGSSASYDALIRNVFQHMYYALTSVLAPTSFISDYGGGNVLGRPEGFNDDLELVGTSIGQFLCHPRVPFGIPPRFNTIWPSMISDFSYQENYAKQATRTYVGNFHLFNTVQPNRKGNVKNIVDRALTTAYPGEADYQLRRRKAGNDQNININNFLVYPEEFFRGPTYNNQQTPTWYLYVKDRVKTVETNAMRLYASLEHFRQRLSHRTGSVRTVFNPYLVPGFPLAIMDEPGDLATHYTAELIQITHNLGQANATTSLSFTHAQSVDEMYELLYEQLLEHTGIYEDTRSAPIHPISYIHERFQTVEGAAGYYKRLFYSTEIEDEDAEVLTLFDDILGVRNEGGGTDRPYYGFIEDEVNVLPDELTGEVPDFVYNETYKDVVESFQAAMRWSSRRVCTLEEFINYHGERGRRDNPLTDRMATYYMRILDYDDGPGVEPLYHEDGTRCDSVGAETKRNWTQRLLRYRETAKARSKAL